MTVPPAPQHHPICIVDDDQPERHLLRLVLKSEGYPVAEASTGQEALRLLRRSRQRFVVLLDLRMPVLGGTEVLRQAAAEPRLATRHAFILISAWPDRPPELMALLDALSVPVVSKPFDLEELLAVIAQTARRLEPPSAHP
jgi:two-component system KDP operon response regulator KdpE